MFVCSLWLPVRAASRARFTGLRGQARCTQAVHPMPAMAANGSCQINADAVAVLAHRSANLRQVKGAFGVSPSSAAILLPIFLAPCAWCARIPFQSIFCRRGWLRKKRRRIHSNAANTPGQPVTVGGAALFAGGECISVAGIVSDTVMAVF